MPPTRCCSKALSTGSNGATARHSAAVSRLLHIDMDYRPYTGALLNPHRRKLIESWQAETSGRLWHAFYRHHGASFFKERHYFLKEVPELAEKTSLLECGCGTGATVFGLLEQLPSLAIFAFDYGDSAIDCLRQDPRHDPSRVTAFVHDIVSAPPKLPSPVDAASLIFVLSAMRKADMPLALAHVRACLHPENGLLIVRDYAQGDEKDGDFCHADEAGSFYRLDGTRSFFFDQRDLEQMLQDSGFEIRRSEVMDRQVINRKLERTMNRKFIQIIAAPLQAQPQA